MEQQPSSQDPQEQVSREEEIRMRAYYLWEQARAAIEKEAPPVEGGLVADEPLK